MPITKEMVEDAVRTAHHECRGPEGCIHAPAVAASMTSVEHTIARAIRSMANEKGEIEDPALAFLGAFYAGLHVGYRLHQIVAAEPELPFDSKEVN